MGVDIVFGADMGWVALERNYVQLEEVAVLGRNHRHEHAVPAVC